MAVFGSAPKISRWMAFMCLPAFIPAASWFEINFNHSWRAGLRPEAMLLADKAKQAMDHADYSKAEGLYKKALERCGGDISHDTYYAELSDKVADSLFMQRQYDSAEPFSSNALTIQINAVGKQNKQVAFLMRKHAGLLWQMRRLEEAISILKDAALITKATCGPASIELYDCEAELGYLLVEDLRYADAITAYQTSIETLQKRAGDKADYSEMYRRLGRIYRDEGQCIAANKMHNKALEEYWKSKHHCSDDIADSLLSLSLIHSDLGYAREAAADCEETLRIQAKTYGTQYPGLASTKILLGFSYARIGRTKEAELIWSESLQAMKAYIEKDIQISSTDLHNLGLLSSELGHFKRADLFFHQAICLERSSKVVNYFEVARTAQWLARLYIKQGQYEKALALLDGTTEIRKVAATCPSALGAITEEIRGSIFEHNGKYREAQDCYRRALEARITELGSDAPLTKKTLAMLANIEKRIK